MSKKNILIASVIVVLLITLLTFGACSKVETVVETTTDNETQSQQADALGVINPLTGVSGYDETLLSQKNVGIVVENLSDARPQWGMSTPDVLIEYEVEGGISRMLWLYADMSRIPETVGPVRSARHDIVELALGWDLTFIHCGGSNIADDLCAQHPELTNIDAMYNDNGFVRDQTRNVGSEHRLTLKGDEFRNTLALRNLNTTANPDKKTIFNFAATPRTLTGQACNKISFSYSASFNYAFDYDAQTGLYACSLNGSPRVDDQNILCTYNNVFVLSTDMVALNDKSGHQDLLLEQGGTGYYLNGGIAEAITWSKTDISEALKLYAADGTELTVNPGTSYIGFVRSTQSSKTVLE